MTFSELYFSKLLLSSTHELSEVNFEALPDSCGIVVVTFVPSMDENPERFPTKDSIYILELDTITYKSGQSENFNFITNLYLYVMTAFVPAWAV